VETESVHELTAAYALDALDVHDESAFEEHLRTCDRCRSELASFRETAASIAYAVPTPAPPPALRSRIIEQAKAERANVVPLRRRWVVPALGAAAAVAAAAAIGLGIWAASLHSDLSTARHALAQNRTASGILGDPAAQHTNVAGARGTLVVDPNRRAVLSLTHLPPAPKGKTYEIWVIEGKKPRRAGTFHMHGQVVLDRLVPQGSTVAVTVEKRGGVNAPTQTPSITAKT